MRLCTPECLNDMMLCRISSRRVDSVTSYFHIDHHNSAEMSRRRAALVLQQTNLPTEVKIVLRHATSTFTTTQICLHNAPYTTMADYEHNDYYEDNDAMDFYEDAMEDLEF
jgi:hypothetical protein